MIPICSERFVVVCHHRAYILFFRSARNRRRDGDVLDANADRLEDGHIPGTSYLADELGIRRPCGAMRRLSALD